MLDELDSVQAFSDPAAALLEVLDPEQNSVSSNYGAIDLSGDVHRHCLTPLAPPLRDRLELIEVSGYLRKKRKLQNGTFFPNSWKITG